MKVDAAYILCAGLGTRMGPIGSVLPKPLWPLFEKTCLDLVIEQVNELGIEKIFVNSHHCNNLIHEHISNEYGSKVKILYEPKLLGSGGCIHNLKMNYSDLNAVMILNSDFFCFFSKYDIKRNMEKLKAFDMVLTSINVKKESGYNKLEITDDLFTGVVKNEKINLNETYSTFSGISFINLKSLELTPGESSFFDSVANVKKVKVGVSNLGEIEWWDLGTKRLYSDFYFNILKDKYRKSQLKGMLERANFLDAKKINNNSYFYSKNAGVFNLSNESLEDKTIESNTFIFSNPKANILKAGIYFDELYDPI